MEIVDGHATIDDVDRFIAQISKISNEHGVTVQTFDARYIVDRAHVEHAVELAIRAIERGESIAREEAVEILLYAAGRRQINQAMEMGISAGESSVVAVVVDTDGRNGNVESAAADSVRELLDPGDTLGRYDRDRICSFFDITATELSATDGDLSDLVRERVALLVIER